jgi:hypothetical protein
MISGSAACAPQIRQTQRDQFGQSDIDLAAHLPPHPIRVVGLGLKLSDTGHRNSGLRETRLPAKTETARQADLVRLLERVSGM